MEVIKLPVFISHSKRSAIYSKFPLYPGPEAKSSCIHSFELRFKKGLEVYYEGLNRILLLRELDIGVLPGFLEAHQNNHSECRVN